MLLLFPRGLFLRNIREIRGEDFGFNACQDSKSECRQFHIHEDNRNRHRIGTVFRQHGKKNRTGPLYHLSHGQRGPDGLFYGILPHESDFLCLLGRRSEKKKSEQIDDVVDVVYNHSSIIQPTSRFDCAASTRSLPWPPIFV